MDKTDINWAADYKLPTLDSQFTDAPLTVNKCLEESIGNLWFSKAEPAAVKLHKIIANGDLPKDHILFKLLPNIVSFVDLMSSGNRAEIKKWAWDEDVKDFIRSVRKVGGRKTLRLLRGPSNFGKGSRWKEFDIRNSNIPLPSLSTLHKVGSGYTPRSGIILPFLCAFIKLASNESKCFVENNNELLSVIVARGIDGFGLKAGCYRDQHINELIGTTFILDVDWIKQNSTPSLSFLRDHMVRQAEPDVLTSLDKRVSLPIGVNYLTNEGSSAESLEMWKERLCQIQTCLKCLNDFESDYSTMKGKGSCNSYCGDCENAEEVCEVCRDLGYTSIARERRACFSCKRSGIQCVRLLCPFTCSDRGSPYKAILLNEEIDSKNIIERLNGVCGAVPDAIHIVKCICCSLTNWLLIVGDYRINLAFLRTLRESDPKLGPKLRELLPLDSLRKKDRMDSEHPLLVSSIELWSLFSCKQFCPVCSSKEGDTSRCDDCLSLCTNRICRLCHIVQPLVPERWRLAKDNQEGVIESP